MFKLSNKGGVIKDSSEVIKSANKKTSIPSIINAGMKLKGDVYSEDIVEIFGTVEGNVVCEVASLRENSSVTGQIKAKYVKLAGQFKGDVRAAIVHITSTADVDGRLEYGIISIEEKAKFRGDLSHVSELLTEKTIESERIEGGDGAAFPKLASAAKAKSTEKND